MDSLGDFLVVHYKKKTSTPDCHVWISWLSVIKNKTQYTSIPIYGIVGGP